MLKVIRRPCEGDFLVCSEKATELAFLCCSTVLALLIVLLLCDWRDCWVATFRTVQWDRFQSVCVDRPCGNRPRMKTAQENFTQTGQESKHRCKENICDQLQRRTCLTKNERKKELHT